MRSIGTQTDTIQGVETKEVETKKEEEKSEEKPRKKKTFRNMLKTFGLKTKK